MAVSGVKLQRGCLSAASFPSLWGQRKCPAEHIHPARNPGPGAESQFISEEVGDVAFFMHALPVLIGMALFKLHGFSTDDALGAPLTFENLFESLNVQHLVPPGRGQCLR